MSAIDCLDHVHAANFLGMPVYWIIEERAMSTITDFQSDDNRIVNKNFISLGGGSGEHAALIINIDGALFNLLSVIDTERLISSGLSVSDEKLANQIDNYYDLKCDDERMMSLEYFDNNHWPAMAFVRMYEGIKNFYTSDMKNEGLEKQINCAVAMLILSKFPLNHCIVDEELREIMQKISLTEKTFFSEDLEKSMDMFEVAVKGNCSGRILKNGQVNWGYCLEDFEKDN